MTSKLETEFRGILYIILGNIAYLREYNVIGTIFTLIGVISLIISCFAKDNKDGSR